ncbi:unnamed protein product [Brassica rapa]|uniref:Uncharacterized protein n=1 Tax=Brassica campestris TaxID=3711 RepID=A0A8D9M3C0_BRACM|nr:unnamed protein product [Brassica rapa]
MKHNCMKPIRYLQLEDGDGNPISSMVESNCPVILLISFQTMLTL